MSVLPCEFGDHTKVVRLGGKCFYLLSHLAGPQPFSIIYYCKFLVVCVHDV